MAKTTLGQILNCNGNGLINPTIIEKSLTDNRYNFYLNVDYLSASKRRNSNQFYHLTIGMTPDKFAMSSEVNLSIQFIPRGERPPKYGGSTVDVEFNSIKNSILDNYRK